MLRLISAALLCLCFLISGCEKPVPSQNSPLPPADVGTSQQRPLKLIVVDDPALASAANREWTARAERTLEIVTVDTQMLRQAIADNDPALIKADAIVFPPELLGELASHGWLQPIPSFVIENAAFADGDLALYDDVMPLARQSFVRWGESVFAVPMGARVLTLGYRKDVLAAIGVEPPSSFAQLQAAIQVFGDAAPGDRWPEQALALPLAEHWAATTLLAYAAPLCRDRGRFSTLFDLQTMQPSIDSPGFQRALELITAGAGDQALASLGMGPLDTFEALWEGKCLFAIGWPATDTTVKSDLLDVIGIAEFPGADESFSRSESAWIRHQAPLRIPLTFPSGRIAAALRSSRSQKPAWNLVVRLGGKEWGLSVASASQATGPVRASQLATWPMKLPATLGYRETIRSTLERRRGLPMPRMPGANRYLRALDSATRAVVLGETNWPSAVAKISESWHKTTSELGLETQIQAYYRNLGLEP